MLSKDNWKSLTIKTFKKVLPTTMVLKAKYNSLNEFVKLKARLVCLGNLQAFVFGKQSWESPTVAMSSLLLVLALTPKMKHHLATFDIKGAFLHAEINEEVYVRLSRDVADILCNHDAVYKNYLQDDGTIIVQLQKCLYGLRQSPRAWFDLIDAIIKKMGYKPTENDTCLYVKHDGGESSYLCLYVDDMLLSASTSVIAAFREGLNKEFGLENVTAYTDGNTVDFLGMRIIQDCNFQVHVSQTAYIENIVEDEDDGTYSNQNYSSPHNTEFSQDRSKDSSPKADQHDADFFRKKTMQLMYVAVRTRPDILLDIVVLSSRMKDPSIADLATVRRIISYLYNTRMFGLTFRGGEIDAWGCTDASFNCYENGRGHTGILFFLDKVSAAVLAKSMSQKVVSGSSTHAELIGLNEGVLHILWMVEIIKELVRGINIHPIKIYNDNQSMITLVKQPIVNRQGRSKFMNRALFKVNENIQAGEVVILYEATDTLVADFLTKAVHGSKFKMFRAKIMGSDNQEMIVCLNQLSYSIEESICYLLNGDKRNKLRILWLEASW